MQYKCVQNMIVCRLDRGENVVASIADICDQEGVSAAGLSAIGAVNYAEIGLYQVKQQVFRANILEGEYELVSLNGSVSGWMEGVYLHVHAALQMNMGRCAAGI